LLLLPSVAQEVVTFDRKTWSHKQNREEYARIFSGEPDKAIANMNTYLKEHPDNMEVLYGLSVAYYFKQDKINGELYFVRSLAAGMPLERFMAGPRDVLAPLYKAKKFRKLVQGKELIHGPMTGSVTGNSAKVWIRTFQKKSFEVIVAEDSLIKTPVGTFTGQTYKRDDYTGMARITGLQPNTKYYYSVKIGGVQVGPVASFHTFPATGEVGIQKIVFGGGAFYNPDLEYIWEIIAKQKPDLFLGMGDNVYIDHPDLPEVQKFCYYQRESSPEYREMLESVPYFSVWDDHDFGVNDSYGGPDKNKPAWKPGVLKVYKENTVNPYYGGGEENPGTWYNFSSGDVDFFMLDTRYYRIPSFVKDSGANANMLGKVQMEWLKEKLEKSKADFKVIVSSIPWSDGAKDIMEGRYDTWRGYTKERKEIFDFLTQHKIEGVVLLSADRHRHDAWKHIRPDDYALYEFTSSRLTNIHYHELRTGALFGYNEKAGFGMLEFNTKTPQPYMVFRIMSIDNELIDQMRIYLHQLKTPEKKKR
jgi:alkaline phosphatase D